MQIRGHIIELNPNDKQVTHLKKACGVARFAYNWGLSEWMRQYDRDINASINILNNASKVLTLS